MFKKINPVLAQTAAVIRSHVKPEFQEELASCIKDGREMLSNPELHEALVHQINADHDPAKCAGAGATRMVYKLYQQRQGLLSKELLVPAAMIFAFEYLDLLAKSGKVQVTPELIGRTTTDTGDAMLSAMGVTPLALMELSVMKSRLAVLPAPAEAA